MARPKRPGPRKKPGRKEWIPTPAILKRIENLAAQGLTSDQIAVKLGVNRSTFYEKKTPYPEISDAISRGKEKGVAEIANVVYQKAKKGSFQAAAYYLDRKGGWKPAPEPQAPGTVTNNMGVLVVAGSRHPGDVALELTDEVLARIAASAAQPARLVEPAARAVVGATEPQPARAGNAKRDAGRRRGGAAKKARRAKPIP